MGRSFGQMKNVVLPQDNNVLCFQPLSSKCGTCFQSATQHLAQLCMRLLRNPKPTWMVHPLPPELVPPIKGRWDKLPSNTGWLDAQLLGYIQPARAGCELVSSILDGWPQLSGGPAPAGLVGGQLDHRRGLVTDCIAYSTGMEIVLWKLPHGHKIHANVHDPTTIRGIS